MEAWGKVRLVERWNLDKKERCMDYVGGGEGGRKEGRG